MIVVYVLTAYLGLGWGTGLILIIWVGGDSRVTFENFVASAVMWPWFWYGLLRGVK